MRKTIFLFLIFIVSTAVHGQDTTNTTQSKGVTFGAGMGFINGGEADYAAKGIGLHLGYYKEIWKDRLRINPNVLFIAYNELASTVDEDDDARTFNSTSFRLSFNYDLLRYKAFNLEVETGPMVNHTKELLQSADDALNKLNVGIIFSGGLRIAPQDSKWAVRIIPVNLHVGTKDYLEIHALLTAECKL